MSETCRAIGSCDLCRKDFPLGDLWMQQSGKMLCMKCRTATPPTPTTASETPRTDADIACYCLDILAKYCKLNPTSHQRKGKERVRQLERELNTTLALAEEYRQKIPTVAQAMAYQSLLDEYNKAKAQIETLSVRETCKTCGKDWSPSIVESGTCIFCICAEKEKQLQRWREVGFAAQTAILLWSSTIQKYQSWKANKTGSEHYPDAIVSDYEKISPVTDRVIKSLAAQRELKDAETPNCAWKYDEAHDKWDTACGEGHVFTVDSIKENNHRFCPYCGKVINETKEAKGDAGG